MPHRLISQQTLLEHEIVARLTEALRTAVAWNQHGDLSRKLSSVQHLTESFQRHVERMFEQEEQDGYIDHVEQSYPQYAEQVAAFRSQHSELRGRIGELLDHLQKSETMTAQEADLLFDGMQILLNDIDSHNKSEMNLLEEILVHSSDSDNASP